MKDKVKAGILMELGMLKASNAFYADTAAREPGHELSLHTPAWAYLRPKLANAYDRKIRSEPLFEVLESDPGDKELIKKTKLAVFIGACNSDRFKSFMECRGCVCVVFEPCLERYLEFIRDFDPKDFAKNRVHTFWGELNSFASPLSMLLESLPFEAGFPLTFIQPGLASAHPEYVQTVTEQMEFMFYRQILAPVEGQQHQKCHPIRDITAGLFYDQQKHMYDNMALYTKCPSLREAQNIFNGETALLVASGPDLDEKLEYIAENKDKCVLISINRALKTLQDNGIEPHFAVVNDTSIAVEKTFADLNPFKKTVLAAHCLSHTGADGLFPQKLLFGNVDHNVFGQRPNLRLYGSVISTAFSLARFLGCKRCVFAGAQLCSNNPWSLDYSKTSGVAKQNNGRHGQELPQRYPQLYPVKNLKGEICYTTLNFRDSALWLLDEIKRTGIQCVNTTHSSIIFGKGVSVDENHHFPQGADIDALHEKALQAKGPDLNMKVVAEYVNQHKGYWRRVFSVASENEKSIAMLLEENEGTEPGKKEQAYADVAALAMNNLNEFDKGNISYLVQRFNGFSYRSFYSDIFVSGDLRVKLRGLHHYFKYVALMAKSFIDILEGEAKKLTPKE